MEGAVERTRAARPDLRFDIRTMLCDGDLGAVAGVVHLGSDAEPSQSLVHLMWLIRLADGRMAEMWTYRRPHD